MIFIRSSNPPTPAFLEPLLRLRSGTRPFHGIQLLTRTSWDLTVEVFDGFRSCDGPRGDASDVIR